MGNKNRRKRIIIFAQDAGSAKFLAPVLKKIHLLENTDCQVCGYGQATSVFSLMDIPFNPLSTEKPFRLADAQKWLHGQRIDIFISGTSSMRPDPTNVNIVLAAKRAGVKTIAFFDHWKSWDRFQGYGDKERFFPDILGVMDSVAKEHLTMRGYPQDRIFVVGHPWLEDIGIHQYAKSTDTEKMKQHFNIPSSTKVVSLLSQPLAGPARYHSSQKYLSHKHIDGVPLWRLIYGILEALLEKHSGSLCLLIRPHPRQMVQGASMPENKNGVSVLWEDRMSGNDIIAISDVILGLDTIMLIESLLQGKRVLNLNLKEFKAYGDDVGIEHLGRGERVSDMDSLAGHLERLLFSENNLKPDHGAFNCVEWKDSTLNCLKLIQSHIIVTDESRVFA